MLGKIRFELDKQTIKDSFRFGWQTELSSLLQFLNYRFSLYALSYLCDIKSIGVFNTGVAMGEAIWVFSRSISLVQYSNVLQIGDTVSTRKETTKVSLISLFASIICILVIWMLPSSIFFFFFGWAEFEYVKTIILIMSPGILAIAISNVYGNFFSAIGKLKILIIKSATGLLVTVVLSLLLIPKMGIIGASIVNSCAYMVSTAILIVVFFRGKIEEKKQNRLSDRNIKF
jgi:O-antigen/teichoic acid export membrane protein